MSNFHEQILAFRWGKDKSAYVNYFVANPKMLDELAQCIYQLEEYPIKEYASWMFMHILKRQYP
ncbi:MAG: hypothetical protein DCO96_09555 [Fluviicola sp. XM-24bin1]|nr:MAG: hypothetical protein DCO96_09555 [Fluviicola sp. XM-24bin1]